MMFKNILKIKTINKSTGKRSCSYLGKRKIPSSNEARQSFIEYFVQNHGHQFYRSSSVRPDQNDPSLLFVNAGMNQFKPIFLEQSLDQYSSFQNLRRAVNSQKCIRAGGKHCDLDAVGRDYVHHTFFEMLGNWSFNDYYKSEACSMAWDLLTNVYRIDPQRLFVTVFGGDEKIRAESDLETYNIWREIGLNKNRIIFLNDNFWEMSDVGPCGICTEIYYLLEDMDLESSTEKLLKNSVEIWNIVFIQNFRDQNKVLHPLRKKFVDTGMGFERILSILQNVPNNYATDLFVPYFENISKTCKWPEYSHKLNDGKDIAYRIIADHCRMATVSIADGMFPNDRGSGYIVRRIIRRAIDSLKTLDKIKPLSSSLNESKIFSMLIDITVDILSPAFPEISQQCSTIHRVIDEEIRLYSTSILRDNLFNKYSRLLNIDLSEKFNINESNVLDKLLEIEKNLQKILSEMQDNLQIVENQLNQSARTLKIIEELIALNLANKFGLISEKITKKLSIVKFRLEEVEKELEKKSKELLRSLEIRDNAYDNGRRKNFTILSMETGKREKFLGLNYDYLSKIALDNYGHQPLALILQENSETILLQTSVPTSHTDRLNAKIWCDSSLEKLKEFYSFQIEPRSSKRLHKLCKYQIDHKSKDELIDSLSKILFTIAQKHFDFEK